MGKIVQYMPTRKKTKTTEDVNREFFGEFFNDNSVDYLKHSAGSRWFRDLLFKLLQNVNPSDIKTVADVGCGIGHKTAELKEYFKKADVTGFDFSDAAIKVGNTAYAKKGLSFSRQDITQRNYTKKYDLIAAFDVLEHIDDWEDMTKKLIKVNNKYLLLSFPVGKMRPYEKNIGHFRNFQKGQMEKYLDSQGYVTVSTFYAGFPFYSPVMRDLTNVFFKSYSGVSSVKMGFINRRVHDVWYVLFRYLSLKHRGDVFIGLFRKEQ